MPDPAQDPPRSRMQRMVGMDDDLWERLDEAVRRADPDDNRSAWLRRCARWCVGDIGEPPRRPEPGNSPRNLQLALSNGSRRQ